MEKKGERVIELCKASKQLDCILSQYNKWPGMSWVLKNGMFLIDERDLPSDFCKTRYQQKNKMNFQDLFYWHGRIIDKEHESLPNQGYVRNLSWIYKCYWCLTWFVILNEQKNGYKCLSPVSFYVFPGRLTLVRMSTCVLHLHLTCWPSFFLPKVSVRTWLHL